MSELKFETLPVLPLRDMVVYPHGVHPLFVGTESSIKALEAAMANDKQIFLVAKKDPEKTELAGDDLFAIGTVSSILQLLKLHDIAIGQAERITISGFRKAALGAKDSEMIMKPAAAASVVYLSKSSARLSLLSLLGTSSPLRLRCASSLSRARRLAGATAG